VKWLLAIPAGVLVLGLFGWLKFKRDEKVVADFLRDSGVEAQPENKTTYEISSSTNLHERRVRKICRKSARIRGEDEDSWKFHS